jgi:FlaG/FlaF family flagellin (archaellin)
LHDRRWNRKGVETILAALLLVVIVAVMMAIVYSWSTGVFGSIMPAPAKGAENIAFENQAYNVANNNVTLYLRNVGTAPTTFASYYVKDMSGDQCSKATGWSSGPYSPTQLAIVPLGITSPYCTWTGTPFTFQPGNVYTVTLVTSHNNQFSFTIQR